MESVLWLVSAFVGLAQAVLGLVTVVIATRRSAVRAQSIRQTLDDAQDVDWPVTSAIESRPEWEEPGA